MPVLCFGPVCVPLNLLLPFLLGILHHYGYFKWVKHEWVTFRHWQRRYKQWRGGESTPATAAAPAVETAAPAAPNDQKPEAAERQQHSGQQQPADSTGMEAKESDYEIICSGDVCSVRPMLRKSLSMPGGSKASKPALLRKTTHL